MEFCQTVQKIAERVHPGARISRRAVIAGSILALCSTLGFLEFASYVYLRVAEGYDGRHLMMHQFDDYKNIHPTLHYQDTRGITHNGQGFRRTEDVPMEKPPNTYRIFLMGGSTAYGLGSLSPKGHVKYPVLKNNETIDHLRKLSRVVDGIFSCYALKNPSEEG